MNTRNSYLISHAFRNYLWASLLSSLSLQMAVTTDAVVVGRYIGADALSAINLLMPVTTLVAALSSLIGLGPAILASKAIGNRKCEKVNMVFTSAVLQAIIIGCLEGMCIHAFSPEIASLLCHDGHILPYLMEYLEVVPWGFGLTILVFSLVSLVEADGHPKLAAKALAVGCLANVLLDVLWVGYGGMGVRGAAWAMVVNNLLVIGFFALRLKCEGVSYRWLWPRKNIVNVTLAGLKEGMFMMLNDLLYSLMLFLLNSLMFSVCGGQGLFFWSICVQLLLLVIMVVDGGEGAVLSIGSMLMGEDDRTGFRMLVRRLIRMIVVIVAGIVLLVWLFPETVMRIFGEDTGALPEWSLAVRVFSLMLLPYAVSMFMRSFFQAMDYKLLGMAFSLVQFVGMIVCLWMAARWLPQAVWWSFPVSAFLVLTVQLACLLFLRRKKWATDIFLHSSDKDRKFIDLSIEYSVEPVMESIGQVCTFLDRHKVNRMTVMSVNICCEELMLNIVRYQSHKHNPYMDLHIAVTGQKVSFVLKDAGRPFNPVLLSQENRPEVGDDSHLGLMMVNSVCTTLTHKYMYGQNIVFAEFGS